MGLLLWSLLCPQLLAQAVQFVLHELLLKNRILCRIIDHLKLEEVLACPIETNL